MELHLIKDLHCVLGASDGGCFLHSLRVRNFIVISTRRRFIPKEEHVFIRVEEAEAVRLIPPLGEHIEADLPSDGELQPQRIKTLPARLHKLFPYMLLLIILEKLLALLLRAVTADWANVEHPVAELDKGAALNGDVEIGDVVEAEVDECLEVGLAQVVLDALDGDELAVLVGGQPVLAEHVVDLLGDVLANLLADLGEIGSTDNANGNAFAEVLEEFDHLGRRRVAGLGEGPINVKKYDVSLACFFCHLLNPFFVCLPVCFFVFYMSVLNYKEKEIK